MAVELTVAIPTHDRRELVIETLRRLEQARHEAAFEVIVVDNGSTDGSADAIEAYAAGSPLALRLVRGEDRGPAAGRNAAVQLARAPVCLFLGDDTWPRPGLIARHAAFHRRRRSDTAALLGRVVPAPSADTPLNRWLHGYGVQFGYELIGERERLPGTFFYTANVSIKLKFLRRAGGFDERFARVSYEDIELGVRLERACLELAYDSDAVAEHCHQTDILTAMKRMRVVGETKAEFASELPSDQIPRRPAFVDRVAATILTALNAARVRPTPVRHATWRFLCAEAHREAFWLSGDGDLLHVGARLARLAARDPQAS